MSLNRLEYQELDLHSHVLLRPDTYVGSIRKETLSEFIETNGRIFKKDIETIPAIVRIFIEALSNAIDNKWRSEEKGVVCKSIRISIDKESGRTTIWNDGLSIPVSKQPNTDIWIPEMLFGRLLTSSNYNDNEERYTSGKNGLGISLCNIFSKEFYIEIVDPPSSKIYRQSWRDNMKMMTVPLIKKSKLKGYTKVSWIPDFAYFGTEGYTDDMIALMNRYVYDAAMLTGVSVYLNDEKIKSRNLKTFAMSFENQDDEKDDSVVSFEYKNSQVVVRPSMNSTFDAVSFVNGIYTREGGIHITNWADVLFKPLAEKINKKFKNTKLSVKDIKNYFRLFVVCNVVNPEFSTQTKDKMTAPRIPVKVDDKIIATLMKWKWVSDIEKMIKAKEMQSLEKTERKRGFKSIEGFDPANKAGSKHSMDCTLILCEGLSAKTFAVSGIKEGVDFGKGIRKGRDWYGINPLRGKCLNTRTANIKTITSNKEISNLIQILGLSFGMDYTLDENFKTLRYGSVLLLTDSDVDGIHISSLVMNFFDTMFPSLLSRSGFLTSMKTPVIKITDKKKNVLRFYDSQKAKDHLLANPSSNVEIKYYKGLGTSSTQDIRETFGKRLVLFEKDETSSDVLNKVFHKDFTDERKEWLRSFNPDLNLYEEGLRTNVQSISISDFINTEMIKFSIEDCKRSIPSLMDGLKESQRKILFALFLKNLPKDKSIKVAQLAGFVGEKTSYHHGEQNLYNTIIKMAQDFVGSNNVPILFPDGQFGSRSMNGKDAANARYVYTRLSAECELLFHKDDGCVLNYLVDEGVSIEPEYYVPILPMVLINGVNAAIGTGWSCSIPCYNPVDIRDWILKRLDRCCDEKDDEKEDDLVPWYRGFKGTITRETDSKFVSRGILTYSENRKKIRITEVPIGMSIEKCKEILEKKYENKEIKSLENHSDENSAFFEITPTETFKMDLSSSISTNNLVLFDSQNKIHKYNSVYEILEEFCETRLAFYLKRIEFLIPQKERILSVLANKVRFIKNVMKKELVVFNIPEKEIIENMKRMKFVKEENSFGYLLNLSVRTFTKENILKLEKSLKDVEKELVHLKNTTPREMWKNELFRLQI